MHLHIYAGFAITNNYYTHNFTRLISCIKFTESRVCTLKYLGGLNPSPYTCMTQPPPVKTIHTSTLI